MFTLKNVWKEAILAILASLNWKIDGRWERDGNGISEVGFAAQIKREISEKFEQALGVKIVMTTEEKAEICSVWR